MTLFTGQENHRDKLSMPQLRIHGMPQTIWNLKVTSQMSRITCYSCRQICYTYGYNILSDGDGKIFTAKIVFSYEAIFSVLAC